MSTASSHLLAIVHIVTKFFFLSGRIYSQYQHKGGVVPANANLLDGCIQLEEAFLRKLRYHLGTKAADERCLVAQYQHARLSNAQGHTLRVPLEYGTKVYAHLRCKLRGHTPLRGCEAVMPTPPIMILLNGISQCASGTSSTANTKSIVHVDGNSHLILHQGGTAKAGVLTA